MAQIEFVKDSNSNFFIIHYDFGRRKDRLVQISVKRIYMEKKRILKTQTQLSSIKTIYKFVLKVFQMGL